MTRHELEAVIERQLVTQRVLYRVDDASTVDASRRAILAAVDEWAASQVAAAVTPPATLDGPRVAARIRARLARALDTTTGGTS